MQEEPTEAAHYLRVPIDGGRTFTTHCLALSGVKGKLSNEPSRA